MSVEFKENIGRKLTLQERSAEEQLSAAKEKGEEKKVQDAQEILIGIDEMREGFKNAGVRLEEVHVLDSKEEGGKVTLGAYERKVHQVGRVGIANIEAFLQSDGDATLAEKVESTLKHEVKGHKEAHKKAISRGVDGQVEQALGEEAALAIDEANAMAQEGNGLGNKPAVYRGYERDTVSIASELHLGRSKILKLFAEGREDEIAQAKMAA